MNKIKPLEILNSKYFVFTLIAVSSIFILYFFNGTGHEADSINHYLHAKYAAVHHELYLDHWAKPLFTLLASPFAQLGFIAIKSFNVLCAFFTCLFLPKIADSLGLKNKNLTALFYFIFPLSFITTFSGLTEPLCALLLVLAIHYCLKNKLILAAILISFCPFVRSEGLILIGTFALYFLAIKQYKILPYLLSGQLLYSLIGWSHFNDFFWVFTKIPYASMNSPYGSGKALHFAEQLIYVTGVPLLICFIIGLIYLSYVGIKNYRKNLINTHQILLGFLLFFLAHSLFWYLGIFNSMGLKRVLASVTPLMAIISLYGFNALFEKIRIEKLKGILSSLFLIYILTLLLRCEFLFSNTGAGWHLERCYY